MGTWVWIVIGVVAIAVLGVLVDALRTRRMHSLQDRFGREYERTVDKGGGRREAEQELSELLEVDDEFESADDISNRKRDLGEVRAHDNVQRLR